MYTLVSSIIEEYKAVEMAEELGMTEQDAVCEWYNEVGSFEPFETYEDDVLPIHSNYICAIDDDMDLYYNYGACYYYAVIK